MGCKYNKQFSQYRTLSSHNCINCNDTLWSDPGNFAEVIAGQDIIFFTETHQSPERPLPRVCGYTWGSAFRGETRPSGGTRGSGGVAVLYRSTLARSVTIERRDAHARYLWCRIRGSDYQDTFIAVCYFPPASSPFARALHMISMR